MKTLHLLHLLKQRFGLTGRTAVIGGPYLWLVLLFLVPFLLVVKISFSDARLGIPPYTELTAMKEGVLSIALDFSHYAFLVTDSLYFATYMNSLLVAGVSTLLCLLIGYPMAYYIARYIGMVYSYLPFLVMPLYAHLVKMDLTLLEAAYDLGAKPWKAFLQITLPLSKNGIIAGCLLVFIPAVGEYVIPELLGGADTLMIGRVMWNEFFDNADWPMASAVTCAMVLLLLVPMALFQHYQAKQREDKR